MIGDRGKKMDYQEHLTQTSRAFDGIGAGAEKWNTVREHAEEQLRTLNSADASLPSEIAELRAIFAEEQAFFKEFAAAAEDYRKQLDGFKAFFATPAAGPFTSAQQKSGKTSWFGSRREEKQAVQVEPKVEERSAYEGQRAFGEAKRRAAEYDSLLDTLRVSVEAVAEDTEEVAYSLRAVVVETNAELREKPSRKLETRRFHLEDAVAACSDRVAQLGLNARVIARLASSEFVENPFDDADSFV